MARKSCACERRRASWWSRWHHIRRSWRSLRSLSKHDLGTNGRLGCLLRTSKFRRTRCGGSGHRRGSSNFGKGSRRHNTSRRARGRERCSRIDDALSIDIRTGHKGILYRLDSRASFGYCFRKHAVWCATTKSWWACNGDVLTRIPGKPRWRGSEIRGERGIPLCELFRGHKRRGLHGRNEREV